MALIHHRIVVIFQSVPAVIAGLLVFVLCAPKPAYAYLDPGTGSYMFQMLLAGVLGFGVSAGIYWKKIKTYVAKKRKSPDEHTSEPHPA